MYTNEQMPSGENISDTIRTYIKTSKISIDTHAKHLTPFLNHKMDYVTNRKLSNLRRKIKVTSLVF